MTYYSCDPATFCQDAQLTNGCKQITDTFGFCCCSSSMCMDPVSHKYNPSSNPSPVTPTSINCFVGYGINNSTLVGGGILCPGSCMRASGVFGDNTLNIFACEPLAICSWYDSNSTIEISCCSDSDNCNTNGYTTPSPPTNPVTVPPIVCYEGIYLSGKLISGGNPTICQGYCSRISAQDDNGFSYDVYTCDPVSLCASLSMNNSCVTTPSGLITGCCCNSKNLCLDPTNNVTVPAKQDLQCFVGYSINNNTLMGSSLPCSGKCITATGTIGNTTLSLFACEPLSICDWAPQDTGIILSCCDNSDNCNTNGYTTPAPPTNNTLAPPLVCYEGIYINGSAVQGGGQRICDGDCAKFSALSPISNSTYDLYTCDPLSLCNSLKLDNNCIKSPTGVFTGCCCNDGNMCMDPTNGIITPIPPTSTGMQCFVGYSTDNNTLVGGSVQCPGQCARASGIIGNATVNLFACEPAAICSWYDSNSTIEISCCSDSDNCNTNGYTTPSPPTNPVTVPPIVCYEGIYLSGKLISGGNPTICQGYCSRISAQDDNGFSYDVYTCDPVSLCTSLSVNNSCVTTPSGLITGCCCNSQNLCLDPANNITIPITPAPGSRSASTAVFSVLLLAITFLIY